MGKDYQKARNKNQKKKHVPLKDFTIAVDIVETNHYRFYIQAHTAEEAKQKILEHNFDWEQSKHIDCVDSDVQEDSIEITGENIPPQRIPHEPRRESNYICYECNEECITNSMEECPECGKPIQWVSPTPTSVYGGPRRYGR